MIGGPLFFASMALARLIRGRGYGDAVDVTGRIEEPTLRPLGRRRSVPPASHFANVPEPVEPDPLPRRVEVKNLTSTTQRSREPAPCAKASLSPQERRRQERREWWARQASKVAS